MAEHHGLGAGERSLCDSMPDAVLITDSSGRIVLLNRQGEALFGYRHDELVGQPVELLLPERSRIAHEGARLRYHAEPRRRPMGVGLDLVARRKDGTEVPVEIMLSPRHESGGVVAVVRDVTETRAAARASRDRELRLRALFDHTFQFIGLLSKDGILLEANQTALELVGYARSEAIGLPFWETRWWTMGPPDQPLRLRAAIAEAALGRFTRFEAEHQSADGRALAIDFSLTPVRDERGEVVYLVPEGRDVTERKALERLREDYLGLVSHDLRNPLGTIALRAETLVRSLDERGLERELRDAELIAECADRIGSMLDELVEATRLESAQIDLHVECVDLIELVSRTIERAVPPGERARFDFRRGSPSVRVNGDARRLERVIVNFLTNALKYTTPGTPIVVRAGLEDGRTVVAVSDAGPGLAPADAARVFDKYHRTHSARQRADGLGLGLYISKLVVEAHGGRIGVDTTPAAGSTFYFSLAAVDSPVASARPAAASSTGAVKIARILVVDDQPNALSALAELLRDEGHVVETAASGRDALARLDPFDPDALVVDMEMPGMSGGELVREVRRGRPDLPCVLMTGLPQHHEAVAALLREPAVAYLGKPLKLDELIEILARLGKP